MFKKVGAQISSVTMSHPSPRTTAPHCLPLDIKDSLKEDGRLLLWAFAFGFLLKGKELLKGELLKGGLLKGKELLKENC
jgi:hypothetical protein